MFEYLAGLPPVAQALLGTGFTYFVTMLGAGMVFFSGNMSRRMLDGFLGFAAGVMVAASYWSLLAPAIEMSAGQGLPEWLPPLIGFLAGGVFLWGIDKALPHLHIGFRMEEARH